MEFLRILFTWIVKLVYLATVIAMPICIYPHQKIGWTIGFGFLALVNLAPICRYRMSWKAIVPILVCCVYYVEVIYSLYQPDMQSHMTDMMIGAIIGMVVVLGCAYNEIEKRTGTQNESQNRAEQAKKSSSIKKSVSSKIFAASNALDKASSCFQGIIDKHIFVYPNIPESKLNNAIQAYAQEVSPNDVIVLVDDTMWGSAKKGILLTQTKLYLKTSGYDQFSIAVSDIQNIDCPKGDFIINETKVGFIFVLNESGIDAFVSKFVDFIADTRNGHNAHNGNIDFTPNIDAFREWLEPYKETTLLTIVQEIPKTLPLEQQIQLRLRKIELQHNAVRSYGLGLKPSNVLAGINYNVKGKWEGIIISADLLCSKSSKGQRSKVQLNSQTFFRHMGDDILVDGVNIGSWDILSGDTVEMFCRMMNHFISPDREEESIDECTGNDTASAKTAGQNKLQKKPRETTNSPMSENIVETANTETMLKSSQWNEPSQESKELDPATETLHALENGDWGKAAKAIGKGLWGVIKETATETRQYRAEFANYPPDELVRICKNKWNPDLKRAAAYHVLKERVGEIAAKQMLR